MGNRVLEYIIAARDRTSAGLNSAARAFGTLRERVSGAITGMAGRLAAMAGVSLSVVGAVRLVGSAIAGAFEFERYNTQFRVLFGNLEAAKRHMQDLAEFSAATPFQLGEIAQASRMLHVFSGGVLGAKESLQLVGDAAATSGNNIKDVAFWVGRAYSAIASGRPFGEAAMRLQEMGILSGEARNKIEELTEAGATNLEIWKVLQGELDKARGGMELLSLTGEGLISTLKDNWKLALAEFGAALSDIAKNDIKRLSDELKALRENGDIAVWARKTVSALGSVSATVNGLVSGFRALYRWSGGSDLHAGIRAVFSAAGTLAGGGSLADAHMAIERAVDKGYWRRKLNRAIGYNPSAEEESAAQLEEMQIRKEAKGRQTSKDTKAEEKPLKQRIEDAMAASQKEIDARKAKEQAERDQKALAKEQARINKELADEDRRLRAENIRQQTRLLREQQQALSDEQHTTNDRLNRARERAAVAWGWYRNRDSFRAQLQEEQANASAEKQFQKDAERLQRRMQWRTRKLGEDDEVVRRVILAREEKADAERAMRQIEVNTRNLAKKLDELLAMK